MMERMSPEERMVLRLIPVSDLDESTEWIFQALLSYRNVELRK